jgi:LuxR family maltose regulon positive regulatory protein
LAHWSNGDLEAAHHWYEVGMASLVQAGHQTDVIAGDFMLADIRIAQGRLNDAMSLYERGRRRATEQDLPAVRGVANLHVGIGELLRERNELDAARQQILAGRDLGEQAGTAQYPYRWRVAMALLLQADGDFAGAVTLLDEAERVYDTDFSPDIRPVPAVRARVYLAQGNVADACRWARELQLSFDDELSYVREYEHITLARVLLAAYIADGLEDAGRQATELLDRLLVVARAGQRTGSVIEVLTLQALNRQTQGDASAAIAALGADVGGTRGLRAAVPRRGRADGRAVGACRATGGWR